MNRLRRLLPADVVSTRRSPIAAETLLQAAAIVESVRKGGVTALREHSARLGDMTDGDEMVLSREVLRKAHVELPRDHCDMLERVAGRIEGFAIAQREAMTDLDVEVTGGRAGHRWAPVTSVGAYAPGGRHPLTSSVLMTVIPARVAGVSQVWLASPRPTPETMAAAWVAGADGLLAVGGAQAIAALAFGTVTPSCEMIVGPGNRWVTSAKKHLFGEVGIDGLAGPSEIVVIADDTADPGIVSADLLAQAEHDTDAIPGLITTSEALVESVETELESQLADLPTTDVAASALGNGYVVLVADMEEAARISETIAPEHLALHVREPEWLAGKLSVYGSLFVGSSTAEAFADYGVGPNHVLPTGGGARFQSGLSVATFLRSPTWLRLDDPSDLIEDTALLARLEGLEAHARSATARDR